MKFPYLMKMSQPIAAYFKIQHYDSVFVIICHSIYFLLFEKEICWIIFK